MSNINSIGELVATVESQTRALISPTVEQGQLSNSVEDLATAELYALRASRGIGVTEAQRLEASEAFEQGRSPLDIAVSRPPDGDWAISQSAVGDPVAVDLKAITADTREKKKGGGKPYQPPDVALQEHPWDREKRELRAAAAQAAEERAKIEVVGLMSHMGDIIVAQHREEIVATNRIACENRPDHKMADLTVPALGEVVVRVSGERFAPSTLSDLEAIDYVDLREGSLTRISGTRPECTVGDLSVPDFPSANPVITFSSSIPAVREIPTQDVTAFSEEEGVREIPPNEVVNGPSEVSGVEENTYIEANLTANELAAPEAEVTAPAVAVATPEDKIEHPAVKVESPAVEVADSAVKSELPKVEVVIPALTDREFRIDTRNTWQQELDRLRAMVEKHERVTIVANPNEARALLPQVIAGAMSSETVSRYVANIHSDPDKVEIAINGQVITLDCPLSLSPNWDAIKPESSEPAPPQARTRFSIGNIAKNALDKAKAKIVDIAQANSKGPIEVQVNATLEISENCMRATSFHIQGGAGIAVIRPILDLAIKAKYKDQSGGPENLEQLVMARDLIQDLDELFKKGGVPAKAELVEIRDGKLAIKLKQNQEKK